MSEILYIKWSIMVKVALFIFILIPLFEDPILCSQPVFSGHHAIPYGFNYLRFDRSFNLRNFPSKYYDLGRTEYVVQDVLSTPLYQWRVNTGSIVGVEF